MKNRYANRSRISESKIRQLLKHFALDLDAQQIAVLCNLNRNTINRYLRMIRTRISEFCEQASPFIGETEVDESYFGARRQKAKEVEGLMVKHLFLVFCKEAAKSIQRLCQTALKPRCKPLLEARYLLKALFILTMERL